jgi:glycerol-3-phosphate acyltransferase PlsY
MQILPPLLVFLLCYLIGSFPTAYVIGTLHGINIFKVGSGNMGANNTTRALGLKWGVIVWALDVGKGILAVLVSRRIMPWDALGASVIGAVSVVIGHNWSLLASLITGTFRGGKGASTAGGTWLMLIPAPIFIVTVGLWVALVVGTRYVSLAVLIAFSVGTLWVVALVSSKLIDPLYSWYVVPVTAVVYYRHRENILALLRGTERRFMERVR